MIKRLFLLICASLSFFSFSLSQDKDASITLFFTSNLEGRFSVSENDPQDPILQIYTALKRDRAASGGFYYDLGNSLFPGIISRFSYGSAISDYFRFSACRGTLVSSKDLFLGVDNLSSFEEMEKMFLSANIIREGAPVFRSFDIVEKGGLRIAIIPVSSNALVFDIAEKNTTGIDIRDAEKSVRSAIDAASAQSPDGYILLSGLDARGTLKLLTRFPEISLSICGGDSKGNIADGKISRIDIDGDRSCLFLPDSGGYYKVRISGGKTLTASAAKFVSTSDVKIIQDELSSRINLWKNHYAADSSNFAVQGAGEGVVLGSSRIAGVLMERYNAEIALLRNPVDSRAVTNGVMMQDLLSSVNDLYLVLTYELRGGELKKVLSRLESVEVFGCQKDKIQGYSIEDSRRYRIVSTQSILEEIERIVQHKVVYRNRWKNIPDNLTEDLAGKRIFFAPDYSFLDRRFRLTADVAFSFFRESVTVDRGDTISTPTGRPESKYQKTGTEDKIDINFYNINHRFTLTPYLYYIKQDETYVQNLFRGTLLYSYNLFPRLKPYNKVQVDTQVVKTDGLRPTILRETAGATFEAQGFSGRAGGGFERPMKDPEGPNTYGLEFIIKYSTSFWDKLVYSFSFDSFTSYNKNQDDPLQKGYSRVYMENILTYSLLANTGFSIKHRWFNYYSFGLKEKYRNTQFIMAIDYKTDFKIW